MSNGLYMTGDMANVTFYNCICYSNSPAEQKRPSAIDELEFAMQATTFEEWIAAGAKLTYQEWQDTFFRGGAG